MIGCHLRQGGSSLNIAQAVVALGEMTGTGTQPDKPQSRCPWSTPFPETDPTKDQADEAARGSPRQWQLQGKHNSIPVRYWNSYSGEHRVREFLWKPTGFPSELSLRIWTPNLIERCQRTSPRKKHFIWNWRKLKVICQHILFPLLHRRQQRSLLNLLENAVNDASQLTKWAVSITVRCLRVNKLNFNWNRKYVTDFGKATITHNWPCRVNIQLKLESGINSRNWSATTTNNIYHTENVMMTLTDFRKMKQPEFHASKLIVVQIPVHSLFLNNITAKHTL